ncbi:MULTISPECIES: MlaC/ttg2D family ABC transporter substrate-binding protein [Idiomarina]|uniref:MlaC/ttg2D family ABC transporter substrate-binding protein n=1 Tax=Idiomarinaceae TaxID=267893 RepID=UPI00129CAA58|nr:MULTISPECIES: ABC transporter substrate-binding protein [Idiomarina]MRJ42006.1 ABC transporter substrate-binding protein [Idiomarina sp. FeN1]NCU57289.1 ABC transporter substrate-binding protein [Idiomarina sp. FenA--70]NCU59997.1 ABC transporter substrate-binding protein [Idiomarina sp. FenBw--71]UUN12909.1 ABC transporter substrate-binding protein [Idiomarina loihiensis]
MKQLIASIWFSLMAAVAIAPAAADELIREDNPYVLLEKVANKTLERIEQDRSKIDADIDYVRVVIREEMMPYVDYVYAAKRVLGRNLTETTEEQRREFYSVFREYLIATYARAFTQYDETKHTIQFGDAGRFDAGSRMVVVNTRLIEQGRPPVRMDFKMRFDNNQDIWQAFDLVVEGVSLLNSKQTEIGGVIRSRGIDGTISLLRDKAQQPITANDQENAE